MVAHFDVTPNHTTAAPLERCRRGHDLIVDDVRVNRRPLDFYDERRGVVSGYGPYVLLKVRERHKGRFVATAISLRPARIAIRTHCEPAS